MKTSTTILAVTVLGAALAAAGSVMAHGGMGMGMGPGMGPGMMGMGMGMGHGMAPGMGPGMGRGMGPGMAPGMGPMQGPGSAAAATARLAEWKASLKISAEQEAPWGKFATLLTQQAETRDAQRSQMQALMSDPKAAAAFDHNAQRAKMWTLHQEQLTARDAAWKDLYAVLTAEQKALADQPRRGHRGHFMAGQAPAR